jgi:hypothetical protein
LIHTHVHIQTFSTNYQQSKGAYTAGRRAHPSHHTTYEGLGSHLARQGLVGSAAHVGAQTDASTTGQPLRGRQAVVTPKDALTAVLHV